MARAKLRGLPDGAWGSRAYGTAWNRIEGGVQPYVVSCTMTKRGEDLNFDFSGSSPQMNDTTNSTWAGTMAQLAVVLTDFLFWDVPWSDGKFVPGNGLGAGGQHSQLRVPGGLWRCSRRGSDRQDGRQRVHRQDAVCRGAGPGHQCALAGHLVQRGSPGLLRRPQPGWLGHSPGPSTTATVQASAPRRSGTACPVAGT